MHSIHTKYPTIWIKNEWTTEDGKSGICVGKLHDMKWNGEIYLSKMNNFFH